ncbi:MAG: nickel-dependent lactate racemase [Synergistaceae bacterium]
MKISLPYGKDKIEFELDEANIVFNGQTSKLQPIKNLKEKLLYMMDNPINSPSLKEIARGKTNIFFVVEDITRKTPLNIILPIVTNHLNEIGIEDKNITLLTAPGTHRVMTDNEISEKYGEEIINRLKIIQHDATDKTSITDLGKIQTKNYTIPLHVNKHITTADLIIGFGSIVPHCNAGYSGGGKIILPGICDFASTSAAHASAAFCKEIPLGEIEDNPCREAIDLAAEKVGLSFIINCVLDEDHAPVGLFVGEPLSAHREGAKLSQKVFQTEIKEKADIVIASSAPADLDFWQGGKGLSASSFAVKNGGIIILASSCIEGLVENHPKYSKYLSMNYNEVMDIIKTTPPEDIEADIVSAAVATENHKIKSKATIFIITDGLCENDIKSLGFKKFDTITQALEEAKKRIPNAKIGIIPSAGTTIPLISKTNQK